MKKQLGVRIDENAIAHLDELARLMNTSRADMLLTLIEAEYDRVQGNPRAKAVLDALRSFADTIQGLAVANGEPVQQTLPVTE